MTITCPYCGASIPPMQYVEGDEPYEFDYADLSDCDDLYCPECKRTFAGEWDSVYTTYETD